MKDVVYAIQIYENTVKRNFLDNEVIKGNIWYVLAYDNGRSYDERRRGIVP